MQTTRITQHKRAESAKNYFNGTFREIVETSTNFDGTHRSQRTRITINHLHEGKHVKGYKNNFPLMPVRH